MTLYRQGYYQEMPHGDASDPSMRDSINKKIDFKKEICDYLRKGTVLAACGSVVKDVLHPENGIIGAPDDVTDGYYIWPADLPYYVEKYNLQLDKVFVDYMKAHDWTISQNLEIDFDNLEVL